MYSVSVNVPFPNIWKAVAVFFLIFNLKKVLVSGSKRRIQLQVSEWLEMRENCGNKKIRWKKTISNSLTNSVVAFPFYFIIIFFCGNGLRTVTSNDGNGFNAIRLFFVLSECSTRGCWKRTVRNQPFLVGCVLYVFNQTKFTKRRPWPWIDGLKKIVKIYSPHTALNFIKLELALTDHAVMVIRKWRQRKLELQNSSCSSWAAARSPHCAYVQSVNLSKFCSCSAPCRRVVIDLLYCACSSWHSYQSAMSVLRRVVLQA